jgi:putative tricarboxylic transport membrane protein
VIDAGLEALRLVFGPEQLIWLVFGVSLGLLIGVLPGIGGTTGMALLLPFLFGMDLQSGAAMLVGFIAVGSTSDTFPSVMLGVPGSGGSQATVMDGYPLARKGRGAETLGAAFAASLLGGLIGAAGFIALVFAIRPIILALASPELFMLTLLGLSMVVVLARRAIVPGLIAGLFGMLIGSIGPAPAMPVYRFTFDFLYLYEGIGLAILALGLFAIPELVSLLAKNESIADPVKLKGGVITGFWQTMHHKWLVLWSSLLGMFIGMLPGLGGGAASWITYGTAQRTLKNAEGFGEGDIRGVIAPESANNSQEGGSLLPTLLLSIPGSPTMAIMLGGLSILGVRVGPGLVDEELPFTISVAWMLALANILACVACIALANQVARITTIPAKKLAPFLLVLIILATYQTTRHWGDIFFLFAFAVIGYAMKTLGWPRAPVLIGFALSLGSERYLNRSIALYGLEWTTRPLVVLIGVFMLALLLWGTVQWLLTQRRAARATALESRVSESARTQGGDQ